MNRQERTEELIGQTFGRLTVTSFSHFDKHEQYSRAYWNCICDCGGEKSVRRDHLTRGKCKSCGCLITEFNKQRIGPRVPKGQVPFNKLFKNYEYGAKERNLLFDLAEYEFKDITSKSCHYCGLPPSSIVRVKGSYGTYVYNGLDRVDSNFGYTIENVVPCCKTCNLAKSDMNIDDFIDWVKRIYIHLWNNDFLEE